MSSRPLASFDEFKDLWKQIEQKTTPEPDPLLDDLARLLNDPRLPDALAESVRACIREHVYQLKAMVGEEAA